MKIRIVDVSGAIGRTGIRAALLMVVALFGSACNSELLKKQAEQIKQQEKEIARQRQEIEALLAAQKAQDQKRRHCNRAFREYFEKAQGTRDGERAIALYREGLMLCPDDDVAHYELGKVLVRQGSAAEAEKEFEAALKINPDFSDAKRELDDLRGKQ
jgi:tetratricopeptide (TPR) repeat protein